MCLTTTSTIVNASGIRETSETIKWHQKNLMRKSVALMLSDKSVFLSFKPFHRAYHRPVCISVVFSFAIALPTMHNPSWHSDLVTFSSVTLSKRSREEFSQGIDSVRHKTRSYWLYCTRARDAIRSNMGPDVFSDHFWWGCVCDMEPPLKCGVQGVSNARVTQDTLCANYRNARRNKQKHSNRGL